MIVRWGLHSLPDVLGELSITRPLLVSTERWRDLPLPVDHEAFYGARSHAEVSGVNEAKERARRTAADGLIALGGGSALDTAKAVSAELRLPIVSIPTTYSGAEWTDGFGVRDESARRKVSAGGARPAAIVYETELTLHLPQATTAGTALNALAHCAEALYAPGATDTSDEHALTGARLIAQHLEAVVDRPQDADARRGLLEGAMHAGAALRAGMCVGHAMAQALGGRYGLPHGTMNAVCLPHALRFNEHVAAQAIHRLGKAIDAPQPIDRVAELARLAGSPRLRDHDVPRPELPEVAASAAARPNAQANPRPAPAEAILEMLNSAW